MSQFEMLLPCLLIHEGGYVNHPRDPGGATNKGVTQRVYDGYRARMGLPQQSVRDITDSEVSDIYRAQYWDAVRADDLPNGLAYAVFDYAVNSGPARAARELQRALGVGVDGVIGQVTISAAIAANEPDLIRRYCMARLEWMQTLRTWKDFGKGWTRRIMGDQHGDQATDSGVIDRAIKLATVNPRTIAHAPRMEAVGKADEADLKKTKKATAVIKDPRTLATTGASVVATMSSVSSGNPVMQYAIAAAVVIAVCVGGFIAIKRLS